MRHHLAASVSKLSALAQREHFAFQEPIEITRGIDQFKSKAQFLRYAGRYVRRPPIAQRRFTRITDTEVQFWTKDLREKRKVITRYSMEDFVATLADHVPDRYWVSMKKALMPLRENVLLRLIQCISVPRKWKPFGQCCSGKRKTWVEPANQLCRVNRGDGAGRAGDCETGSFAWPKQ